MAVTPQSGTGGPCIAASSTRRRPLPAETPAAFHDRGWAVVRNVFTADDLAPVLAAVNVVARRELLAHPADRFTVDATTDGALAPRKIDYPFLKHEAFRALALDPRLVELACAFLSRPGYLIRDQIFCKPPRFGTAKPYHQENAALLITPPNALLVLWIALDDATENNGCLRVIDGSHHRLLPHQPLAGASYHLVPPPEGVDRSREVLVPADRGDVVALHGQTLHASHPNSSLSWRRAYSSHWVTAEADCTTDALRHAYSRTLGDTTYPHRSP